MSALKPGWADAAGKAAAGLPEHIQLKIERGRSTVFKEKTAAQREACARRGGQKSKQNSALRAALRKEKEERE